MPTGNIEESRNVDQLHESEVEHWEEPLEGDYDDFDQIWTKRTQESSKARSEKAENLKKYFYAPQTTNSKQALGSQTKIAQAATFPKAGKNQELNQFITQLQQKGYGLPQIQQQVEQQFGESLPSYEIEYQLNGSKSFSNPSGKYMAYNAGPVAKTYQSGGGVLGQYFQQQMLGEALEQYRQGKSKGKEEMMKLHRILLLVMMGDFTGAMFAYTQLLDRDMRKQSRSILKKLEQVRKARAKAISNFATEQPPRAYAGTNPQASAHAQDKSQKYNQFVQLNTQLMSELQNTERELVDFWQTLGRDLQNMLQAYASFRDNESRVKGEVMRAR